MGCCYLETIYGSLGFESSSPCYSESWYLFIILSIWLSWGCLWMNTLICYPCLCISLSTRTPPRIIHPNAAFEESDFSPGLDTGWYSANGYFSRIYVTCIWQYLRAIQTSDWTLQQNIQFGNSWKDASIVILCESGKHSRKLRRL